MTNLAANVDRVRKDDGIEAFKVAASSRLYQGAMAMQVVGTGYAVRAADTASGRFIGIVVEEANETSAVDGGAIVRCYTEGVFPITLASAAITDIGKTVYATDDNVVALTSTNLVAVGTVVGLAGTNLAWVKITPNLTGAAVQAHIADTAALVTTTITDSSTGTPGTGATLHTFAAVANMTAATISALTQTRDDTIAEVPYNSTWSSAQADAIDKNFHEVFDRLVELDAAITVIKNTIAKQASLDANIITDLGVIRTKQIAIITQLENALVSATS